MKGNVRKLFVNCCRIHPDQCLHMIQAVFQSLPQPLSAGKYNGRLLFCPLYLYPTLPYLAEPSWPYFCPPTCTLHPEYPNGPTYTNKGSKSVLVSVRGSGMIK